MPLCPTSRPDIRILIERISRPRRAACWGCPGLPSRHHNGGCREGKGTGLGLVICRRIVPEHRGTIEVSRGGGAVSIPWNPVGRGGRTHDSSQLGTSVDRG